MLRQQKLDIALTTYSLADKKVFRKNVKAAVERGLSETDALAALTTIPAKLCGVEKQLGTIEPGKIANLTIVDGKGYFDPESRVREVWVDGRNYHVQAAKERSEERRVCRQREGSEGQGREGEEGRGTEGASEQTRGAESDGGAGERLPISPRKRTLYSKEQHFGECVSLQT